MWRMNIPSILKIFSMTVLSGISIISAFFALFSSLLWRLDLFVISPMCNSYSLYFTLQSSLQSIERIRAIMTQKNSIWVLLIFNEILLGVKVTNGMEWVIHCRKGTMFLYIWGGHRGFINDFGSLVILERHHCRITSSSQNWSSTMAVASEAK